MKMACDAAHYWHKLDSMVEELDVMIEEHELMAPHMAGWGGLLDTMTDLRLAIKEADIEDLTQFIEDL